MQIRGQQCANSGATVCKFGGDSVQANSETQSYQGFAGAENA